jgi:lipid-binding SYLF domain-containing protein
MTITRRDAMAGFISATGLTLALAAPASAASASDLIRSSDAALANLYSRQPKAKILGNRAKAILVFPNIVKAGFIVGAQSGNGVLFEDGPPTSYYNISAASYGLQAGVQSFSYALFFITNSSLAYLESSRGWSVGMGPSVVVLDKGRAASLTSTTLTQDVYAIPFAQQGLMAGLGIEGSKITPISVGP